MKKDKKILYWETDFIHLWDNSAAATILVKFFMWTLIHKLFEELH